MKMLPKRYASDKYFAADKADITVDTLLSKASDWFDDLLNNRYIEKVKKSWAAYHGAYYNDGHDIYFSGEQGELVNLAVNHYRNIAQHMLIMVTSTRPVFQPRAINTDSKSQIQTTLAHGLLEYYLREKRLERFLKNSVEHAIVLGSGFIKMEWNATSGQIYDYIMPEVQKQINEETGQEEDVLDEEGKPIYELDGNGEQKKPYPIYEGDVEFKNLTIFDVVFDPTKEAASDHDWVLTRTFKNKFDLAAKYPEYAEDIIQLDTKSDREKIRLSLGDLDRTEDVPVYEFFHKRTECLPSGRYLLFLSEKIILLDSPMPYRELPVYRISPSDILGTSYGYTSMFDLLPLQKCVNSLYSTVLTNQSAFGVQSILNPRGNDIRLNQLEGGMNFIEYNSMNGMGKPEPLNLTQTPPEIFNFIQMIEKTMETLSGVNSVARGNPEASLKSGNALALVQSNAISFISGLQQSYIQITEDIGTGLINLLKDFASVPRIKAITGITNNSKNTEFTGEDLNSIDRVVVDVGNALSQCLEKDTPVLMFDGSVKMVQDIVLNDKVMGPDSLPRTVQNVNTGSEMMYKVTSKNKYRNVSYGCNANHILSLKYCSDDTRYTCKKGDILDISVKEFVSLSKREQRILHGFKTGINFDKKDLAIPPYILGAWLGDGHSACTALTTADSELLNEWTNYSHSLGLSVRISTNKCNGKAKTYFITSGLDNGKHDRNEFMNHLRGYELINSKHIPNNYLISSREDRLELLAGLLDTDGTCMQSTGTYIFTQKNDFLTKQVIQLSESLGFRTTSQKIIRETTNLVNFETEINKVTIGGNTWEIPCRLPRKQVSKMDKKVDWRNYGIDVTEVGIGTFYGFTLKEDPHFVLGDFTVTHNSTAGRLSMAEQLVQMKLVTSPEQYFSVMNTGNLNTMTEGPQNELLSIRSENENLVTGKIPSVAISIDQHSLHIREHKSVLADPQLRLDTALVQRTLAHIQEHINLLHSTDPNLLSLLGEQSLGPQGGSPISPDNAGPQQVPNSAQGVSDSLQNPDAAMTPGSNPQENIPMMQNPIPVPGGPSLVPRLPKPAVSPTGEPTNPQEGMAKQIAGK